MTTMTTMTLEPTAEPTLEISREFLLAGKATLTVGSPAGKHWTYRIAHKAASGQYPETWFVSLLTGPDNTEDYSYLGLTGLNGMLRLTAKSVAGDDSMAVRVLRRVLACVWAGHAEDITDAGWTLDPMGCCGRCGRSLTTPESCRRGIGPDCWEKMAGE
jgi:Family of unknown function (DUF6011)